MSRRYPRFLYSNPTNTKHTGPFIVHLLEPFMLFKVTKSINGQFMLHYLPTREIHSNQTADAVAEQAQAWLKAQIITKAIVLPKDL